MHSARCQRTIATPDRNFAALLASDKTILARSPKLHRPRGPSCFRGACDGCLARVDGVPNVMTCLVPAQGGEHVDAQNVIGSRKADLLRVTDWFFAKGIDHHHLMAGVPGLSDVMQSFATKVAGPGRMPWIRNGDDLTPAGIRAAVTAGFERVKLNTVLMRGVNEHELWPLILFAAEHGLPLRLIELMPVTTTDVLTDKNFFPVSEAMELLARNGYAVAEAASHAAGAAPVTTPS